MKFNQQTLIAVVGIAVVVFLLFSDSIELPSLSIVDGGQQHAGLELWNSDTVQTHTLPTPVSNFEAVITWIEEPSEFYVYPCPAYTFRSQFKFASASSNQYFTIDAKYLTEYWDRFDGVVAYQHMSDDFYYSDYVGGMWGMRTPADAGNPVNYTVVIRYSRNWLTIDVNNSPVVDNHNLKGFQLSSISLSNPAYGAPDIWGDLTYDNWTVCDVTWSIRSIAGEDTPYPSYSTTDYIEWTIPELSWSNKKENFLSEIAVAQNWEWKARITNWKATFQFDDFTPLDGYTDRAYLWIHTTTSDDYLEFYFSGYTDGSWEMWVYDSLSYKRFLIKHPLQNGVSNFKLELEHINGRLRIIADGQEVSDTRDLIGPLSDFSLSDISWDGDWGNWGGSTDIKVELLTEAPLTPSFDFPWWILILVVAVIVVYYAFGGGKK